MARRQLSGNKTEPVAAFRPLSVIRLERLILLTRARHAASLHRAQPDAVNARIVDFLQAEERKTEE